MVNFMSDIFYQNKIFFKNWDPTENMKNMKRD